MIRTAEPGEAWWWCFEDDRLYEHGGGTGVPPAGGEGVPM